MISLIKFYAWIFIAFFFSDGSCLDMFYCDYSNDKKKKIERGIIDKVKSTYGVDIQEVYDSPLPDLFKFIIDNKKS